MSIWNVNTKKEAKAFMEAAINPEKIIGQDGDELCKFSYAIPWKDYQRIKELSQ